MTICDVNVSLVDVAKLSGDVKILDHSFDDRWDAFVSGHEHGWLCHLSGWRRVMKKSFPHLKAYFLALMEGETIQAALPVYLVKSCLTGNRLVSIPFATFSDPLVRNGADLQVLLQAVLDQATQHRIPSVEIKTLNSASLFHDDRFSSRSNFAHHAITLSEDPEQLRKKFHRTCVRQRISRSLTTGTEIRTGTEKDLPAFYRLYMENRKSLGLPPQPFVFIQALWEEFYHRGYVELLLANYESRHIGSLLLFKFRDRVLAEYAVWNNAFQRFSPLHGLFWEAIKQSCAANYHVFDFGRTSPQNQSLMDFKKRWATTVTDSTEFYYPAQREANTPGRSSELMRAIAKRVCRTLPLPAFERLGSFLYGHLN